MSYNALYHYTVGILAGRGPPRAAAILALAAAIALAAAAVLSQDDLPDTRTLHDAVSSLILAGHAFAQVLSNLILAPVGSLGDEGSRELDGAQSIAIFEHGGANYAAVAAFDDDGIQIINLANPASPSAVGHLSEAGRLNGAATIAIFEHDGANYAAVTALNDDGVRIINLTDPASPSGVGSLRDDTTRQLAGAHGIAIFKHGDTNYAAVTANREAGIQIVNLTDPARPSAAGSLPGGSTVFLGSPRGIAIFEHGGANYAAVASAGSDAVQIVNLTDPASPSAAGNLRDRDLRLLDGAYGIAIFKHGDTNYAAVASTSRSEDGVQIVNLANPARPSAAGNLRNSASLELNGARGIAVFEQGGTNYAAVAAFHDDGVQIVNLANPASPSAAGNLRNSPSLELNGAEGIAIFEHDDTNYAAVASYEDDGVQILRITEDTAPTITVTGADPATVEAGRTYADAGATCTDDVDDTIIPTSNATDVNTSTPRTYTVTYTCTDTAGQTATATRTVRVVDTTAPTIRVDGDNPAFVLEGSIYRDAGATCTDNAVGATTLTSDTSDVNTSTPGDYTVFYDCTDNVGLRATTATRTVTVVPNTAPTITVNGAETVELMVGGIYNELGATCTDGPGVNLGVTTRGTVDTTTRGTYTITYSCTDADRNTVTATRTVIVGDVIAPTIKVDGDNPATVLAGRTYVDEGATCSDSTDGDITPTPDTSEVDIHTPGTYTVTYTCTDMAGNTATATRTVIVGSNTPPTLTIWNHRPSVGADNHPSYASDAICTDAEDGNISNLVTTSVSVQANDRAIITYSCTDSDGNTAKKIRQVPVTDTEPPTVVVTGQPVVEIITGEPYTDAGATCTDDRPNATVMTTFSTVDTTTPGTYTVFYECTDAAGNKASGVRTVHVRPVQEEPGTDTDLHPVLTVPGPVTLTVGDDFEAPSATCTDHEDDDMDLRIDVDANSVDRHKVGRYTVFYTCTDSAGNFVTGSLYVNVNPAP